MNNKYVWIVESQSQYDGGHTDSVFSKREIAIAYLESKRYFTGWEDKKRESTKEDEFGFYYTITQFKIDDELDY